MRIKLDSPGLLLGIVAAGVVTGLLLDPRHGTRRRSMLGRSLGNAYEGVARGLKGATQGLVATRRRQTWGGRLKAVMADAGTSVGHGASAVPSRVAGWLGSLPGWAAGLASSVLPRRKSRLDRLREALSDTLTHATGGRHPGRRSQQSTARHADQATGAKWHHVEDEVGRLSREAAREFHSAVASARGHVRAPLLSGGAALVLIGSATYLLALSPGAEDRRRRWGAVSRKWIGEVGDFARVVGRRVGGGRSCGRTRQPEGRVGAGILTRTGEPVSTPTDHPAESLRRAERILPGLTSDRSDVRLLIREGKLVVQGTAAREEYDAVIIAIEGVTPSFVNELQAVSPG